MITTWEKQQELADYLDANNEARIAAEKRVAELEQELAELKASGVQWVYTADKMPPEDTDLMLTVLYRNYDQDEPFLVLGSYDATTNTFWHDIFSQVTGDVIAWKEQPQPAPIRVGA